MRSLTIVLAATSLALSGCFDLTANSQFQSNGTAKVEVEFAISMQMAALVAGFSKGKEDADLLKQCEEKSTQGAALPSGVRWVKSVRGTRGEMLTCTAQFEIDDPVKAAQAWKPSATPTEGTLEVKDFKLERLSGQSYRIAALLEATRPKPAEAKEANPFEAMFATAMLNRYITISISAARIENATGELSSDGRRVTWKLPVVMLLKPPPGYKQEIQADIIYDDGWLGTVGSWLNSAMRTLGLEDSPSTPPASAQPAPKAASINVDEQKKRLTADLATHEEQLAKAKSALAESRTASDTAARRQAEQQALLESIVISKARFFYRTDRYSDQPVISFSIANNGSLPVKRIYVAATLQTPGRAVPWLEESFNYDVRGGLEPKEAQDLSLAPNSFGEWGKVPKEVVGGAVLTLKLTAFEDATGKKIESKVDQEALKKAADFIQSTEASIRDLESKIADLTKRLSQIP